MKKIGLVAVLLASLGTSGCAALLGAGAGLPPWLVPRMT